MNKKMTEKEWMNDFKEFMECESFHVPSNISEKVLQRVYKDLNPSSWKVFLKLTGIHSVVGTLSLGICNQFGMNPFNTEFSLMDYFMKYGHTVCMTLCGFLFIGLSISIAFLMLNRDEIRVFKRNSYLHIFSLAIFSLTSFFAFGADITFNFGILWLIGAIAGGYTSVFCSSLKQLVFRPHKTF